MQEPTQPSATTASNTANAPISSYRAILQQMTATTLENQEYWTAEKLAEFLNDPNKPTNSIAKQVIAQVGIHMAQQEQLKEQIATLQLMLKEQAEQAAIEGYEAEHARAKQRLVTEHADQEYVESHETAEESGSSPFFEEINKLQKKLSELVKQQNTLIKEINVVSQKMAKNIETMITTERDWGTGMNYALNVAKAFVDTHVTFPKGLTGEKLEQAKNDLALGMLSEVGDYLESKNPAKEAILTKGLQEQIKGQGGTLGSLPNGMTLATALLTSCPGEGKPTLQQTMEQVNANEQQFQQAKTDQKACQQQCNALEKKFGENSNAIAATKQEVQAKEKLANPAESSQHTASASASTSASYSPGYRPS